MTSNKGHTHVTNCLRGGGKVNDFCSCPHCTLAVCSVCGCYEGSLTTHCPGVKVDMDVQDKIYKERLDYTTDNGWYTRSEDALGWPVVLWKDKA